MQACPIGAGNMGYWLWARASYLQISDEVALDDGRYGLCPDWGSVCSFSRRVNAAVGSSACKAGDQHYSS